MSVLEKQNKVESRFVSVDVIRDLAMIMVVILHTIYNFTTRVDFFATKVWFLYEPFSALSKAGVLLFFMISGFLVISKNRTISDNWRKTKKTILIPLGFFTLINIVFDLYKSPANSVVNLSFWHSQLIKLTDFPSSSLWFLVALLFLYLLNPLWQLAFSKERKPETAIYLVLLSFLVMSSTTLLRSPRANESLLSNIFTGWLGFVGAYLYGALVRNSWVNFHRKRLNVALMLFGLAMTMLIDYLTLYVQIHFPDISWWHYIFNLIDFSILIMAIGIFNLLISSKLTWLKQTSPGKKLNSVIIWLANRSYGIYLIHTLVVAILLNIGFTFDHLTINVYLYNLLNFVLVLGSSILIVHIIKKIPYVKAVIGE